MLNPSLTRTLTRTASSYPILAQAKFTTTAARQVTQANTFSAYCLTGFKPVDLPGPGTSIFTRGFADSVATDPAQEKKLNAISPVSTLGRQILAITKRTQVSAPSNLRDIVDGALEMRKHGFGNYVEHVASMLAEALKCYSPENSDHEKIAELQTRLNSGKMSDTANLISILGDFDKPGKPINILKLNDKLSVATHQMENLAKRFGVSSEVAREIIIHQITSITGKTSVNPKDLHLIAHAVVLIKALADQDFTPHFNNLMDSILQDYKDPNVIAEVGLSKYFVETNFIPAESEIERLLPARLAEDTISVNFAGRTFGKEQVNMFRAIVASSGFGLMPE